MWAAQYQFYFALFSVLSQPAWFYLTRKVIIIAGATDFKISKFRVIFTSLATPLSNFNYL